ncbi:MAG: diguanylate cyclase [Selenomonadaceae bacterium]|nr:diguanylate cyclase [Selenomonadaceae bacterium]
MNSKFSRFLASAFLYWFVATFAGHVLEIPEKIISIASFIPPMLGLMWGPVAAFGVYFGGLLVIPSMNTFFLAELDFTEKLMYFVWMLWIFLAAYLPYYLWHKNWIDFEKNFFLSVHTLRKFLIVIAITFAITSIFRTLMAPASDFETVIGMFGLGKSSAVLAYALTCFANDFFTVIFFDLAWFFFLVSRKFQFHNASLSQHEPSNETSKAWRIALGFYIPFPVALAYFEKYQIYGMDNIETWMHFILECVSMTDIYLVLMLYLLLRYRRSIMLEVVFLVTQSVFFSASVLGLGSSLAMSELVNDHTEDSLRAMSVICRERLYRTFFSVRQAVDGMRLQATSMIDSYEKLTKDEAYRNSRLAEMKKNFNFIASEMDGSIAFYLRLTPEIAGPKGGFSMGRENARWEGTLSPFKERQPVDLSLYSSDDLQNVGWFYTPMRSRTSTWIEPYLDPLTKNYVVSYVAPLYVEGKFIGVVGMDIDFGFIIQELRRMSIYNYGYVYVMNRNNVILYHRNQAQGEIFQPNPEYQEMEVYLTNGMWLGISTPLIDVNRDRNSILMHLIAAIIFVAMLISILSITFASKAVKPLAGMTEAAKRIASGDLNVKISYDSGNELGILVRSISEMATKLEIYVYRDKLTGLRNAAAYIGKATELDAQSKIVSDLAYGVIIFDANFLKKVNDKYGHEAGNELLKHAAKVIQEVFENSPVYRIGGDEFAAVLEGQDYDNRKALLKLFDVKLAEERFQAGDDMLNVSVAYGLGTYEQGMEFSTVAKKADVAMYNHKAAIKARYGEDVR